MDDNTQQRLSLAIREHLEARPHPKDVVEVHALADALAVSFELDRNEVADAIVRHCDALGAPMALREG
jgi:hypothetical protein